MGGEGEKEEEEEDRRRKRGGGGGEALPIPPYRAVISSSMNDKSPAER